MSNKLEKLIRMANDISNFFDADPDKTLAAEGMKNHLMRNWELRMREAIVDHLKNHNGEGLSPLAKTVVSQIAV